MIPKSVSFTEPWTPRKIAMLERFLGNVSLNGLQSRAGTYTGDGRDDRALTIGMRALLVYIQRTAAGAGNAVFAIREADGFSYISGGGFVANAVKSFTVDGITLGVNSDVNAIGVNYAYFAIG